MSTCMLQHAVKYVEQKHSKQDSGITNSSNRRRLSARHVTPHSTAVKTKTTTHIRNIWGAAASTKRNSFSHA